MLNKIIFVCVLIFVDPILSMNAREKQDIPKFCETRQFHGAFNFGSQVLLRYNTWYWTYKHKPITEPPQYYHENATALTSVYISEVPQCTQQSADCANFAKALYLAPIRLFDKPKRIEYSNMIKIKPNGNTVHDLDNKDVPTDIDKFGLKIWPMEWEADKFNSRPAVYWPKKHQILFIAYSGSRDQSIMLFNNLTTFNWWRLYKQQLLDSDIHFVGMFHLNETIYAIGDNRNQRNYDSKLYTLNVTEDYQFIFQPNEISVRQLFGCETPNSSTATTALSTKQDDIDNDGHQSKQTNNTKIAIIILASLITAALISSIVILLVYCLVKKLRGSSTTSTYVNDDNTAAPMSTSYDQSIATMNSYSGERER